MTAAYDVPTCQECGVEYDLREGEPPSTYCDECAQEKVPEMQATIRQQAERIAVLESALRYCENILAQQPTPWPDDSRLAWNCARAALTAAPEVETPK